MQNSVIKIDTRGTARAEVAAGIRAARDKMNNKGKHWIKGALKKKVSKNHIPGDRGGYGSDTGYCSIGGLAATFVGGAMTRKRTPEMIVALEALAIEIAPDRVRRARKNREYDLNVVPSSLASRKSADRVYASTLESIIIGFNDNKYTTWEQVQGVFTRAARRLR